MSMTILITRNAPDRFRGFLCSCMLELAPGVYGAVRMNKAIRERVWAVMIDWFMAMPPDGGILMVWPDRNAPSGMGLASLGWPKRDIVQVNNIWLARTDLTSIHQTEATDSAPRESE